MAKPLKIVVLGDAKDAKKAFADIRKEADDTNSHFKDVGSKMGGGLLTGIGAVAGAVGAIGLAAAGLFVKGFMDGVESERLNDKLAAQLDLSEGEAAAAGQIASDVYRDAWGENLAEVNDAIGGIIKILDQDVTGASQDVARSLTEDALTIADVWDQEVNEVIRAAGALMDNDLASSAGEAFDIISTGLTEGADLNGDFLDTLFEYSSSFDAAGFSADRMLSGLLAGTDAGMVGVDKVGDAVKEMGGIILSESDVSKEALETLGFDADLVAEAFAKGGDFAGEASQDIITALADLDDPLAQTQLAIALMGEPFKDLKTAGPEVLEALASGTLELRDTAVVASDAYDNTATAMETFKRRGAGALEDFVAAALAAFGVGGEDGSLKSGLDAINTWIAENQEEIKEWGTEFAETVMEVWTDIQPLLEVLGDIAEWFTDPETIDGMASWAANALEFIDGVAAGFGTVADALSAIQDLARSVLGLIGGDSGSGVVGSRATGSGSATRGPINGYADGGYVPGPINSAQLAVVHGGEYVVPVGGTTPGSGNIIINVAGSVVTERDLVEAVRQGLIRTQRRNGF